MPAIFIENIVHIYKPDFHIKSLQQPYFYKSINIWYEFEPYQFSFQYSLHINSTDFYQHTQKAQNWHRVIGLSKDDPYVVVSSFMILICIPIYIHIHMDATSQSEPINVYQIFSNTKNIVKISMIVLRQ